MAWDGFIPRKGTLLSSGNEFEPMRRCLAPEVTSRRVQRPKAKPSGPADEVKVTLKEALQCRDRVEWFTKACEMAKKGRASSNDLFDIISNRKFTAGLSTQLGKTICTLAHKNSRIFSDKQEQYMYSSEWLLNAKYGCLSEDEKEGPDAANMYEADDDPADPVNDEEFARRLSQRFLDRKAREEEEVARRQALKRRLDAEDKERQMMRELRKTQGDPEDFTLRFLRKPQESCKQQLEDEVESRLQALEQKGGRQRNLPRETPREARRRRRRQLREQAAHSGASRPNRPRSCSTSVSVEAASASESRSPSPPPQKKRRRDDTYDAGSSKEPPRRKNQQYEGAYEEGPRRKESRYENRYEEAVYEEAPRRRSSRYEERKGNVRNAPANPEYMTMQHVEALRTEYRQDRMERNIHKLKKLGLASEIIFSEADYAFAR